MKKLSTKEWIAIAAAVVFVAYSLFGANILSLFQTRTDGKDNPANAGSQSAASVIINEIKIGEGPEIREGDLASVHYTLSLGDGTTIQNSRDFGVPFQFMVGAGEVIPGWEQGIARMKVGGIRMIIIPPELGYGSSQSGPIPPNSTLVFTVELINLSSPAEE